MNETIKLTIAVPTAGRVNASFAYSLAGMVSSFAGRGMPTRPEAALEVKMDVIESSVIHSNRCKLVRRALDSEQTHLIFLDDDMTFEPNVIEILLGRRHPIVVTNYLIKTEDEQFVAVDLNSQRVATRKDSTGLQKIMYSGFGLSCFEMDVFKRTPQPWFLPKFIAEENTYTTEDMPFFERVREAGFDVLLDHDASKLVAHVGRYTWRWDKPPLTVKTPEN